MNKKLLLPLALCGFSGASLQAAIVFEESFNGYTTSSLEGQATSSTGLTGNWSSEGTALSADVNFNGVATGLTYSQGSNQLNASGGAINAFRSSGTASATSIQVAPSSFSSPSSSVWMSMLVDYDGTAETGTAMLGFSIASGPSNVVQPFDKADTRSFGIGIFNGNVGGYQGNGQFMPDDGLAANDLGLSLVTGVNLIVARVDDGPDVMEVWLNPTLGGGTPTAGSGTTVTGDGGTLVSGSANWGVNSIFASHNFAAGSDVTMDEFRFGDSFGDVAPFTVVPEPSSYALLVGFLALGCIMIRRRRS